MVRIDKLKSKLLNTNSVFTYPELLKLLRHLGYSQKKTGKTSGSRVAFVNKDTKHIIRIHKPHPGNELKRYVKSFIIEELKKEGFI